MIEEIMREESENNEGNHNRRRVQQLKKDNSMIMGRNPVRITHSLGITHRCNFWLIVPTMSINECMKIGMIDCQLKK